MVHNITSLLRGKLVAPSDMLASNPSSATNKMRKIDILLIDAEGYDAEILLGATRLISKGLVRLLIFEYHSTCPWPRYDIYNYFMHFLWSIYAFLMLLNYSYRLETIVKRLSKYQYDCFIDGNSGLYPINNR
jgi:hypothetical protein